MKSLFKMRNLLLLLAIGLTVALVSTAIIRYRPHNMAPPAVPGLPVGVDLALQKIDYTHTDGGVARWRLIASRAEHQAKTKEMLVKDLELTFFDAQGVAQMALKGEDGQINSDYSAVEIRGNIELTHRDGYALRTSSLSYRQADAMLRTDAPIHFAGRGVTMEGVGLRVDLNKRRLLVPAKVRAVLSQSSN